MTPAAQSSAIVHLKSSRERLPVRTEAGAPLGWLVPITADVAADPETAEAICRWRSDNRDAFLTVFSPSLDKTRSYLSDIYLPDEGRILFFVVDQSGRRIGIAGFRDISVGSAELDLVIRGEPSPSPRLMTYAQSTMLAWAFGTLGVAVVYLVVLEHNVRARRAYDRLGFRVAGATALRREELGAGEYRLVPDERHRGGLRLLRMELTASEFRDRHASLERGTSSHEERCGPDPMAAITAGKV